MTTNKLWTAPDGAIYKEICCFGKNESHMAITLERVVNPLELDNKDTSFSLEDMKRIYKDYLSGKLKY